MTTNDNNSLLAYIASEFTNQTELVGTKSLAYILNRSDAAKDALRELLRTGGADVGPIASVRAEAAGDEQERVDLAAYDEAGDERVLIEAKFWAGLTGNQPAAYLERLPDDGKPSALFFVAPEKRLGTLWPEIMRRAGEGGFALGADAPTENLRTATITGSARRMMLTSWRALLSAMKSEAIVANDALTQGEIQQLNALCNREDADAFLPLRSEQLGPEFGRLMLHLTKLVKDAIQIGIESGFVVRTNRRFSSAETEHGQRIILGGAYAWFGVDYPAWARVRETPLWLVLWDPSKYKDANQYAKWNTVRERLLQAEEGIEIIGDGNPLQIPIYLPVGVEYDTVLDEVVELLRTVAKRISPPNGRPQGRPRKQGK